MLVQVVLFGELCHWKVNDPVPPEGALSCVSCAGMVLWHIVCDEPTDPGLIWGLTVIITELELTELQSPLIAIRL